MISFKNLQRINNNIWQIPETFQSNMRVPARIYASEKMLKDILEDKSLEQIVNVATLPGVTKYALAMPDIHQGYGFPIGGVAAIKADEGIISPGGVGYDINCGVRLLTSDYQYRDLEKKITELANQIQRDVPSGVGRGGRIVLKKGEIDKVLNTGLVWAEENDYALKEDADFIEEKGSYRKADASLVSDKAKKRGSDQLGTLGAGNHFLEIQKVAEVYNREKAGAFGMSLGQIVVAIHTGSRGLGHQVCTDYVRLMNQKREKFRIKLPDRELICAPFKSQEGQNYFKAMAAAANFAWTNRQLITFLIRKAWQRVLGSESRLKLVYDLAHNMAKLETHNNTNYIVHRKGATRAFGPNQKELPLKYQKTGQPVFIPGSMGTSSYVLAGTEKAMTETFGSACHGAGRRMSRTKAKKTVNYNKLKKELDEKGLVVRAGSKRGLLEEAPEAYKDIDEVVEVVDQCQIAEKVAKLEPLAVIKG